MLWVLVMVAIVMGYFYWQIFFSAEKQMTGEEFLRNFEELMKADAVGGQTPEETLKMFIEALRQEDVALAAQYFLLDDEGKRDKWVTYLQDVKDSGLMQKMASDLEGAKAGVGAYEKDFVFEILLEDGSVGKSIDMELNESSGVWKIESL